MAELLVQLLGRIFICLFIARGQRLITEPFAAHPNTWLLMLVSMILGFISSAFSLLFFPFHLVDDSLRIIALLVSPPLAGLIMLIMRGLIPPQHKNFNRSTYYGSNCKNRTLSINHFCYGFIFSMTFMLTRHYGAA